MTAPRHECPTGDQLADELRAAAKASGVTLAQFIVPIAPGNPSNFIGQLQRARTPMPLTIARCRALVDGQPIPQSLEWTGRKGPPRGSKVHAVKDGESRCSADEVARRRTLAERAHAERHPGETLQAAISRLTAADGEGRA
jgi:hypothetical protein